MVAVAGPPRGGGVASGGRSGGGARREEGAGIPRSSFMQVQTWWNARAREREREYHKCHGEYDFAPV